MANVLTRAILSATHAFGLLTRPWRGLGLPMRIVVGPTSGGRMLFRPDEGADSLPSVIGALSLLCDAVTALDWAIVRRDDPKSGTEVVTNLDAAHALWRWPAYARWAWVYGALLAGNGVAHVVKNARNAPMTLRTYPAPRVAFRLYENGALAILLAPAALGDVLEVADHECAVLRYRPSGADERIGVSPLTMASPTIDLLLSERAAVRATMQNAARPSAYLKTDQRLTPERAQAIRERWNSTYQQGGMGGTAVLEQGLDFKTVPLNDLTELAAVETARMGVGDVARLLNIPPSLLIGIEQNRATAVEDRRRLLTFSVEPIARQCESALSEALLTYEQRAAGYAVRIDTSVAMLGSGVELSTSIASLLNSGAVSVNEARQRLGLASVAGGDELRSPANTWPLSSWLDARPRSSETTEAQGDAATRMLELLRGELAG